MFPLPSHPRNTSNSIVFSVRKIPSYLVLSTPTNHQMRRAHQVEKLRVMEVNRDIAVADGLEHDNSSPQIKT
jgi:hypothetical protein